MRLFIASCLLLGLCAMLPTSLVASESQVARQLAAEVIQDQARARGGSEAAHLQAISAALRRNAISLAEAESLLRILALSLADAHPQPSPAAAAPDVPGVGVRRPEEVLGMLDGPRPASPAAGRETAAPRATEAAETAMDIAELERWAGARNPGLALDPEEAAPAAPATEASATADPEALPAESPAARPLASAEPRLPSDQAHLPPVEARVRMIEQRQVGERQMQVIFIDRGAAHGLAEGHRLRVMRGDDKVVLLSVFNVREQLSAALVLDGTWADNDREVRQGDRVVRDD
ncbi:MAG: hypothetical protein EA402_06740 [Planctomycetota bacterium]|nr:MAG: hypothetical protein EA402_06740 [Planctomycetota bacterium]